MDNTIRQMVPKNINGARIETEEFISLFNEKKIEVVDIRTTAEINLWKFSFTKNIPLEELPDRLDELSKEKEIIVVCPNNNRSNMARLYLASKGFNVRYLEEGLLGLVSRLRGGKAKDLKL